MRIKRFDWNAMPEISIEQIQKLSQYIYQKLGLHFDEKKVYFLKTRVAKRHGCARLG